MKITLSETAHLLSGSPNHVWDSIRAGVLASFKLDSKRLWPGRC